MSFNLVWGKKVSPAFIERLRRTCVLYKWGNDHANWLMACMAFESGETFSPSIKNAAGSGATGLIQFMPATAKGLGTSTEILAGMSPEGQLAFVERYFGPYHRRIQNLPDMYMAILLPKYVGAPLDSALFVEGTKAYTQNKGLDTNQDGVVTKQEAAAKVQAKFERGLKFAVEVLDIGQ